MALSPDTRQASMTIGQFARRCGLSYKALRLYDLSGLLAPAHVDPVTGYRRYRPDQLERARRISQLRQLEMPLWAVAEVLAGTDEQAAARLERWWVEQEMSMRSRRGLYEHLRAALTSTDRAGHAYQVGLREVPETKLATIRCEVDQPSLVPTLLASEDQVEEHLRTAGAEPTGETWWIYHGLVTPDSEAPVEACVPFTGTVDPAGPITIRVEPAHSEAYVTITGHECSHPRIMAAYDAVEAWVRAAGRVRAGPAREIYFARDGEEPGDAPFAHVAQPVEREA